MCLKTRVQTPRTHVTPMWTGLADLRSLSLRDPAAVNKGGRAMGDDS